MGVFYGVWSNYWNKALNRRFRLSKIMEGDDAIRAYFDTDSEKSRYRVLRTVLRIVLYIFLLLKATEVHLALNRRASIPLCQGDMVCIRFHPSGDDYERLTYCRFGVHVWPTRPSDPIREGNV